MKWLKSILQKRKGKTMKKALEDISFIAAHPPGRLMTVEERLRMDRIIFGMAAYTVDENGVKTRIDPTTLNLIYD